MSISIFTCPISFSNESGPVIKTSGGTISGSPFNEYPFCGRPIKLYSTTNSLFLISSSTIGTSLGIILTISVFFGTITLTLNWYSPASLIFPKSIVPMIFCEEMFSKIFFGPLIPTLTFSLISLIDRFFPRLIGLISIS